MTLQLRKKKTKTLAMRIAEEDYATLKKLAAKEAVSVGEIARAILADYLIKAEVKAVKD